MFRQNTLIAILFAVMGLWVFIIGAVVDKKLDFEKDGVGIAERATINIAEDSNSGLNITTDSSGGKLTYTFALREDCSNGQVVKAGATTTEWACGNDLSGAGGSAIVLDLADDDADESADLSEIAITGDTNSIFTEPSADKLLIALALNWPSADTADALDANPSDCGASTFATTIAANGNLTCEAVDGGAGGEITDDSIDANDIDETSGYTWTGEHDFGGGGIEIENNSALPGACTVGQIFLDTDATSGQQLFGCEGGSFVLQGDGTGGGSAITFDIGDDGGDDSVDLTEIATTGDTNTIFTESAADKMLIAVGNNWPTSDTADALSANPTDCGASTFAQSIVASGNLTCAAVDLGTSDVTGTLDVSDHLNLVGGTNITLTGDTLAVDDAFVSNGGDAIAGDLDFNDGVTDSPKATFTPATGTAWDIFAEDTGDDLQIEANTASEEALDIVNVGAGTVRLTLDGGLTLSGFDCTGNANGGALTTDASGVVSCSDDDGGGGSGDVLTVNSTAVDTTGNFLDGDIDFTHVDGGPGGPDDITATVACSGCVDITDIGADAVDGSELVEDSVDTTELDDTEAPAVGQLVATDNATATRLEYIAVGTGLTHDGDTLTADLGTAIDAGEITAAAIDGDDINSNIAGRSLTLTAGAPDTLDIDVEIWTDTKGIWFEDPTAADDFKSIWIVRGFAATLTKIWCESDQTVTMMLQVDDGTPADVDSVDLVCITTPDTDDALNGDVTMADGDRLDLDLVSVSGTPTFVSIMWTFTKDE